MDRSEAWVKASVLIQPVVAEHGLEEYSIGQLFSASTNTKVDQHLDHIMRTADWLLGVD